LGGKRQQPSNPRKPREKPAGDPPRPRKTREKAPVAKSQGLTPRQAQAIAKVLSHRTVEAGCQAAGISTATFYKWLCGETFRTEFERQRDRLVDTAMGVLVRSSETAATALAELLEHSDARLRRLSAKDIIELSLRHKELAEIEKRLNAIEERIGR